VLYDGAMVSAHVDTSNTAVAAARAMAEMVLDRATHGHRSRDSVTDDNSSRIYG
jgi:hypothetical protein